MYNKYLNQLFCDVTELKKYVVKKLRIFFNADEIEDDTSSIIFTGDGVQSVQTTPNGDVTVTISGGENNVQSDWEETDNVDPSFIQNKPTPTDLIFTGNVTTTQTGPNEITVNVDNTLPYKIYTALLTQSATDAPLVTVLENTIGNIVWSRDSEGYYKGILNNAFTLNKTFVLLSGIESQGDSISVSAGSYNVNEISIFSKSLNDLTNNPIFIDLNTGVIPLSIEIRVYN